MRFLHTSDWHLGIQLHKESRIEEQKKMIEQLTQMIVEEKIDVVLLAGDVYDTTLATQEAIEVWNLAVDEICGKLKKKMICIAGNHDSPSRLSVTASLLKQSGLYIIGKVEEKITPIVLKDVWIYAIPYFHPQTIARIYQKDCKTIEEGYQVIVEDIRQSLPKNQKAILMAHGFIQGSKVSESDRFAQVGGSELVSKDIFDGFHYVALGHLHRFQKLKETMYYSGSPIAYSFSEAVYEKKVCIYDSETNCVETRVLEPFVPLFTCKGNLSEVEQQLKALPKTCYAKVELDEYLPYETIHYLKERYETIIAVQGKQWKEDGESRIQMEELTTLRPQEIVHQFLKDYYDSELNDIEQQLLEEALLYAKGEE